MRCGPALALCACGKGEEQTGDLRAADFTIPPGLWLEYAPLGDPDGAGRMLEATGGTWELRSGAAEWESGSPIEAFAVELTPDLKVGDDTLLPARVRAGERIDGAQVVSVEAWETWYGTFEVAAEVEVDAGRWQGTQAFALGFGLVTFTLDGEIWDLRYYERP